MRSRPAFTFLLLIGTCFSTSVWADATINLEGESDVTISSNVSTDGTKNYLQSDGYNFDATIESGAGVTVVDGSAFYLNGKNTMTDVKITNNGTVSVTGLGWGLYVNPYQTWSTSVTLGNYGVFERIQMAETDGSTVVNTTSGEIVGSALFGTNGLISNYGTFTNKDNDAPVNNISNLVSFEKNSSLVNGLLLSFSGEDVTGASFFDEAKIETDNVQFTNAGALVNSGQVDNKTITMLNEGKIYNIANPFDVTNAGDVNDGAPTIATEVLTMGDTAYIQGDQGTNFVIGTMKLGNDAQIKLGEGYVLPYEQVVTVKSTVTTDEATTEEEVEKTSNRVPKLASMNVTHGTVGNNANIQLLNGARYAGQTLTVGDSGTINIDGGKLTLSNDVDNVTDTTITPTLSFGNAGTLDVESLYRAEVIIDNLSDGTSTTTDVGASSSTSVTGSPVAEEQTVAGVLQRGQVRADNVSFKDNGLISLIGAGVTATRIDFGDYGTITGDYYEYSAPFSSGTNVDLGTETGGGTVTGGGSGGSGDDSGGGSGDDSGGGSGGSTVVADTEETREQILNSLNAYPNFATMDKDAVVDSLISAYNGGDQATALSNLQAVLGATEGDSLSYAQGLYDSIFNSLTSEASLALAALAETAETTTTDEEEDVAFKITSDVTVTDSINFGNYGSITAGLGLTVNGPLATFKNNGTVVNHGSFNIEKLDMGDNANIETYSTMKSAVSVGSHSRATLLNDIVEGCDAFGECKGGSIEGGFVKKDGAVDVEIISATDYAYYGYLANRIIVDKITVQQNMLNLDDVEVNGVVDIGTDAWLRLSGKQAILYDPIRRVDGATNTTVEIALDDNVFFTTRNTVEADHVIVSGGGFEITQPINVGDIRLDSNTTVRITGNFATGDLNEVGNNAVNTSFSVDVGTGNYANSSGNIALDRVDIESGIFNAYDKIVAVESNLISDIDGIELGTDSVINVYNTVETGRVARQQNVVVEGEKVTNTTMNIYDGQVTVNKNVDLDNLTFNRGRFVFLNQQSKNVANITNDVHVGTGALLAGAGVLNLRSGNLTVADGGHLGVSAKDVADQALTTLLITKQSDVYDNSDKITETNAANVVLDWNGFLDVRASGDDNDVINVDGTLTLNDGTRVIVRNPNLGVKYDIATADTLVGSPENIRHSFLWKDTVISTDNNTLSITLGDIDTLPEGIAGTPHSKNVDGIAEALEDIREQVGQYAVEDFLDNIFYAVEAQDAIDLMDDYSPEGYLNAQTAALRTVQTFRQGATDALDNLRSSPDTRRRLVQRRQSAQMYRPNPQVRPVRRVMPRRRVVPNGNVFRYQPTIYNPNARSGYNGQTMYRNAYSPVQYGRAGGDSYRRYVQRRPQLNKQQKLRSDRGGVWINPFVSRVTQNGKDGILGYDYDSYGVTFGADRKFGATAFGVIGMIAEGELKQKSFKADTSSYGLGVYGSYQPRSTGRFIDFYALWATNANKGTRQIDSLADTLKADYDVTTTAVGVSIGYDIPLMNNVTITPRVGLDYTKLSSDEIEEKGDSPVLIHMSPEDFTSIKTPLELKAAMKVGDSYMHFMPEAHIRWTHEFGDTAPEGKATFTNYQVPFGVSGLEVDSDTFTLGGSLSWLTGASELSLKYDYEFSSSLSGHTLNAGYKYIF